MDTWEMKQSDSPRGTAYYGYIVVACAFMIMLVTYGTSHAFGVFFKPLITEFGWTRAMTATAQSLAIFMHGVFYIVMGRLNDRYGPRIVLTVCGLSLGLGFVLMSQVTMLWQMYLFYGLVIALGMSGYVPLVSTIAKWFEKKRGMMTGIVLLGAGLGTMVIPPLAERLISIYDWRISYGIIGVLSWVIMLFAAQFLRQSQHEKESGAVHSYNSPVQDNSRTASSVTLRQVVRTQQFWFLLGLLACQRYIVQAVLVHIVPNAMDLGFTATTAAALLTIIGGVSLVGRVAIGSLGDRIGNKMAIALCYSALTVALCAVVAINQIWMVYLFAIAFGLLYGGMYTLGSPMTAELFGLRSHGFIFGILSFGGTIGGAFGPALTGHVYDINGSYDTAFILFAVISVLGLLFTLFIKPVRRTGV